MTTSATTTLTTIISTKTTVAWTTSYFLPINPTHDDNAESGIYIFEAQSNENSNNNNNNNNGDKPVVDQEASSDGNENRNQNPGTMVKLFKVDYFYSIIQHSYTDILILLKSSW